MKEGIVRGWEWIVGRVRKLSFLSLFVFTVSALVLYGIPDIYREAGLGALGFAGASLLLIKLFFKE